MIIIKRQIDKIIIGKKLYSIQDILKDSVGGISFYPDDTRLIRAHRIKNFLYGKYRHIKEFIIGIWDKRPLTIWKLPHGGFKIFWKRSKPLIEISQRVYLFGFHISKDCIGFGYKKYIYWFKKI